MKRDSRSDAKLLGLGRDLDDAWAQERLAITSHRGKDEARIAAAVERCSAIVERIVKMPAFTVAGLRVKVRAFNWARCDDPDSATLGDPDGPLSTEERLLHSILIDLSGAEHDGSKPGRR